MRYKEYPFSEFDKATKELFKALFGQELYDKLNSIKVSSIDWNGLDITECFEITAGNPNISERFTKESIKYYKERGYTVLDLYLQSIHHYGFYNAWSREQNKKSSLMDIISKIGKDPKT